MTGIGGVLLDGDHSTALNKLKEITSVISHRGRIHSHIFTAEHLREIDSSSENSNESTLIGLSILEKGKCNSNLRVHDGTIMVLDSNLSEKISPEIREGCAEDFHQVTSGGESSLLRILFGTVAVYINESELWVFRSVDGTKPVFYVKEDGIVAFSTERKGLWNAGFVECNRIEPSYALRVDWAGNTCHSKLTQRYRNLNLHGCFKSEIVSQLETSLEKSFDRLRSLNCAVLFSGGIDSSLAAFMADRVVNDVVLITAKAEGSHDADAASSAAKILEMKHLEVELNEEIIWNVLPRIIYSIESTDKMDVEIAIPFFLSTLKAKEEGYEVIVSGQGPDELFAGYYRYLQMYDPENPKNLDKEMKSDISSTYRRNIERDEFAIANAGGQAFFPYLSTNFVELGLATPVNYKISLNKEPSRKVILRELAISMGLPGELASARKKATQYSSGTSDLLVESIRKNVSELSGLGKGKVSSRVQEVLESIGQKVGVPSNMPRDTT
ncbi:MAG: asparagine synthetase B [Candidatus Thorarchaeota archaeon]|nr:asparagine synthetase B [Candidatus Thorarchaeota archaeon]